MLLRAASDGFQKRSSMLMLRADCEGPGREGHPAQPGRLPGGSCKAEAGEEDSSSHSAHAQADVIGCALMPCMACCETYGYTCHDT